jgi:Cu+-exporting ATPase
MMSEAPVLHTTLSISGATCENCAKKIRNALEPLTGDVSLVEVNLQDQTVALPEGVDAIEAARIVSETGYPAETLSDADKSSGQKINEGTATDTSEERDIQEDMPAQSAAPAQGDEQVQLAVSGATCASCVNSIEKALKSVPGVSHAHMNLADNIATATGVSDPQALIRAVESAGYGASVIEDADTADELKQAEDKKLYKTLLLKMAISLGLGLVMMV